MWIPRIVRRHAKKDPQPQTKRITSLQAKLLPMRAYVSFALTCRAAARPRACRRWSALHTQLPAASCPSQDRQTTRCCCMGSAGLRGTNACAWRLQDHYQRSKHTLGTHSRSGRVAPHLRCVYMKREQENAVPPPAPAHHKTDKPRGAVAWAAPGYVAQAHVHGVFKATTNVPSIHWARVVAVVGSLPTCGTWTCQHQKPERGQLPAVVHVTDERRRAEALVEGGSVAPSHLGRASKSLPTPLAYNRHAESH